MQVYSDVRAAWLVFMRSALHVASGDSWQFCTILQRDIDMVKDHKPACRPGSQTIPVSVARGWFGHYYFVAAETWLVGAFTPGVSGTFLGTDDEYFAVLSMDRATVELYETSKEAMPTQPLCTATVQNGHVLALYQGPKLPAPR